MKNYDFAAAKRYIQMHADKIECAQLGMHEDWFWTAETVFKNGFFTKELDVPTVEIGGISGSRWAAPTLEITFKDGSTKTTPCYTGESDGGRPEWFDLGLGCMSGPIQEARELQLPAPITIEQ